MSLSLMIHYYFLIDPPKVINITTTSGMGNKIDLRKSFGEIVLNASAEPYTCQNVKIIWTSSKNGTVKSCEAEGKVNNVDPFTGRVIFQVRSITSVSHKLQ